MSAYCRYAACAAALLLAACGNSPATLKCLPCSSDADCQSPAFCSRGYCVANGEDPRRCPQQVGASATGSSSGSTTGTSTSTSTSSTGSASSTSSTSSTSSSSASATSGSGSTSTTGSGSTSTSGTGSGSTSSSSSTTGTTTSTGTSTTTGGSTSTTTTSGGTTSTGSSTTTTSGGTTSSGTSTTGGSTTGGSTTGSSCTDGAKNGNETGVDCGGGTCPACAVGVACALSRDCQSSLCLGGVCACDGELAPIPVPAAMGTADWVELVGTPTAPQIELVGNGGAAIAGCSGRCAQGAPTFTSGLLVAAAGTNYLGARLAVPDAGLFGALSYRNSGDVVTAGYCAGSCTQASNWVSLASFTGRNEPMPAVAVDGADRTLAFAGVTDAGLAGTIFAECSSGCDAPGGTWSMVRASSTMASSQRGVALAVSTPQGASYPVHHLAVLNEYDYCTGPSYFCGLGLASWTRVSLPPTTQQNQSVKFDTDVEMQIDANGLPHLAGMDCCSRVYAATCHAWPCSAANWTTELVASDYSGNSPNRIGFQLDAAGLGHIVYDSQQGLAEADEAAAGTWVTHPLTTCDGQTLGSGGKSTSPSLLLTASGSPRVAFILPAAVSLPDGGSIPAGPAWYVGGP